MNLLKNFLGDMTLYNIITQLIGFIGLMFAFICFQQNDYKKIRIFQIIIGIFFTIHFFMLGAYTGCVLNFISLLRAIVYFYKDDKKWASNKWWIFVFLSAFVFSTMLTWKNIWDILPLIGCFVLTFVLYVDSAKFTRLAIWPSSVVWIIYNFISGSIAGLVTELFNLSSIIIGIIRHDIKRKK